MNYNIFDEKNIAHNFQSFRLDGRLAANFSLLPKQLLQTEATPHDDTEMFQTFFRKWTQTILCSGKMNQTFIVVFLDQCRHFLVFLKL